MHCIVFPGLLGNVAGVMQGFVLGLQSVAVHIWQQVGGFEGWTCGIVKLHALLHLFQ